MDDLYLNFFNVVDDPKVFVFRNVNLVKAFYDEYTNIIKKNLEPIYRKDLRKKYSLRSILKYLSPARLIYVILFIYRQKRAISGKTLWYGLTDRHVEENGKRLDVYNYNIIQALQPENVICMQDSRDKLPKIYPADLYLEDFAIPLGIMQLFISTIWYRKLHHFANTILLVLEGKGFTKRQIIRLTVKFWAKYYLFRFILKTLRINKIISLCHYSKHSFSLACRHLGKPNLELMHGHIMQTHPYYNIPNLPKAFYKPMRELLPDSIGVYGEYWKNNLQAGNQFDASQVKVVGYYLHTEEVKVKKTEEHKKIVLFTTQPYVQNEIIEYVRFLKTKLSSDKVKILIKPHPAEDIQKYLELQDERLVFVSTFDVYSLLPDADVHISVFSTVLFEAVRYRLCNYVLFVDRFAKECNDVIKSGVAKVLYLDEIPEFCAMKLIDPHYYFDDFHPKQIQ